MLALCLTGAIVENVPCLNMIEVTLYVIYRFSWTVRIPIYTGSAESGAKTESSESLLANVPPIDEQRKKFLQST